jgi:hypothetical protein
MEGGDLELYQLNILLAMDKVKRDKPTGSFKRYPIVP